MTTDASVAKNVEHATENTEARDIKIFLAVVLLVVVVAAVATTLFGLAGLGVCGIGLTVAMLIICLMLTKG